MKKVKVLAYLLVCVVLFVCITLIPAPQVSVTIPPAKGSNNEISISGNYDYEPYEVVAYTTPIVLPGEYDQMATSDSSVSDTLEGQNVESSMPVQTPGSTGEEASRSDSESDENSQTESGIPMGGYPKVSQSEYNLQENVDYRVQRVNHSQQVFEFPESYLYESPMVPNGKHSSLPPQISQSDGLDIIPKHSGINGRSIYGVREHKIEDGDSLEKLAIHYLGDAGRYEEIMKANPEILSNKDELPIGAVLIIPERF